MPRSAAVWIRTGLRILAWCALVACIVYSLIGGEYPIKDLWDLHRTKSEAKVTLEQIQATNDSLRAYRKRLDSDVVLLEHLAREQHGLIRDGEVMFRLVRDAGAEAR